MATHKLSILVEAIGAAKASKQLAGVDKTIGNIGARAGQGLRTAGGNLVKVGAIAAAGIGVAVKTGLSDLAELESAVTSVDGAIDQVGTTWKTTGTDIAGIANRIESEIGAAFDDKEIVAATSGLIRYGKVTEGNIEPAMQVMTDLAARVGSVSSAGELMAKALADPARAAGKLSRYGIILTKQQQKQLKAMVEAGDEAGAQALLLDELAKSTTGAAKASQGPYQRALSVMEDVTEDARKALAEGFLPVITKVADLLSEELAKPGTMDNIREFGHTLADGLDNLVDIARNLPWTTIGDSLKLAGQGAKTVLNAFANLPDWVQTAVLTGWGLNKLTGGALSGIVGELGKGLVKGVLGMNAGVVNIKAGVVTGAGGGVPGAGAGAGLLGLGLGTIGAAVGIGAAGAAVTSEFNKQTGASLTVPGLADIPAHLRNLGEIFKLYSERKTPEEIAAAEAQRKRDASASLTQQRKGEQTTDRSSLRAIDAYRATAARTNSTLADVGLKAQRAGERTASAIRDKDMSFTVNVAAPIVKVMNNITAAKVSTAYKNAKKYGAKGTSSNGHFGVHPI